MAIQRNGSRKRRALARWLVGGTVGVALSITVPLLLGDPPLPASPTQPSLNANSSGADTAPSTSSRRVLIRFADQRPSGNAPTQGQQPTKKPDGQQGKPPAQTNKPSVPPNTPATPATKPLQPATPPGGASGSQAQSSQSATASGKLTADAGRTSNLSAAELGVGKPLTFATDEEKNQKIAPDWKDPWAVFFITGRQSGYMEPCGCTGLANQKGGLNRRDTLLSMIRDRGWNVIPIDGGNQVGRFGRQAEIKYGWSAKAFNALGYQATTYGEDDLQLDINALLHPLIGDDGKSSGLFVSANVSIVPEFDVRYKILTVRDRKIGITAAFGDENAAKIRNAEVTITPAIPALKEVAAKLREAKCDYQIVLIHASLDESVRIVQAVPGFSLAITAGGFGEPTFRPEQVPGTDCQMVQVGVKGMYAGIFGLFDDKEHPFRYQRIALSSQFEDSPRMLELFGKYQDEIKAASFSGLGLRPVSHPTTREFVGSEKCGECHTKAFDIWSKTPHAHATDSIIEPPQRTLARHFDPECLSCHVTGWNPQKFYPYRTGYTSLEETPQMVGNGCENCHGPGAKHVAAELGDIVANHELLTKLREEMRLPLDRAQDKCTECHDADNSPEFHKDNAFEEYYEKIKHVGKD